MKEAKKDTRLVAEIRASLDAQRSRHDRWHENRQMYYNEHGGPTAPFDGAFSATYPLVTQIVDRLSASVVDIITGADPYYYPQCYTDPDAEEVVEKAVQFFMELSGYRDALKKVSPVAAWSNKAWLKTLWDEENLRFKYKTVEPFNTFVYPAFVEELSDARSFGDLTIRTREQIEDMMEKGLYDKVDLPKSADGDWTEFGKNEPQRVDYSTASVQGEKEEKPDDKFTVYDCMTKDDGKWKRKSVLYPSGLVLKEDPWPEKMPFSRSEFSFKTSVSEDGYWPPNSVVTDIAQYQLDADAHLCDFHNAVRMSTFPAVFIQGSAETAKAVAKYGPNQVIEGDLDGMQVVQPKIDLEPLLNGFSLSVSEAEKTARVSSLIMGNGGGSKTATQSEGEQQWQAQMVNEYIRTFGKGCLDDAEFHQRVLWEFFDAWQPVYGDHLGVTPEDRDKFKMPMVWNISVDSVEGTAMSQMAMIDGVAQYGADPEFGVDKRELLKRRLQTMDRRGVTNADALQRPPNILEAIVRMAEEYEIDPDELGFAVDQALSVMQQREAERLAQMEGMPGDGGVPTGAGMEAGAQPVEAGSLPAGQGVPAPGQM